MVAGAEAEAPYLGLGDVDVVYAGFQAIMAEEAIALVGEGEDAAGDDDVLVVESGGEEAENKLALLERGVVVDVGLSGEFEKALTGEGLQVRDINARWFCEDGGAHCGGGSPFHGLLGGRG